MTSQTPKSEFSAEDRKLLLLFVEHYADAKQLSALGLVFTCLKRGFSSCCYCNSGDGRAYGLTDIANPTSAERYCDHHNITGPLREAILQAHAVYLLRENL